MKRIVRASLGALALGCAVAATPVLAASQNVEAAIKSLAKIEADAAKFKSFCQLIKDMDDVPDQDTAKAEALETQLENLLKSIGFDVLQAWDMGSELDPATEDGKAFEAAVEALEDKCPE
jgi:hypothetical protein